MASDPILSAAPGAPYALALSHGVIALLVVLAMLAARDAGKTLQGRLLFLLALSVAGLEAASGPGSAILIPPVRIGLGLAGTANVALLWLFGLSILRDDFKPRAMEWIAAAGLVLGPTVVLLQSDSLELHPVLAFGFAISPLLAILHIAWIAFSERTGDLVEPRRRFRLWIPAALAASAAVSVLSEEVRDATTASIIRNGLATLPVTLALIWWLATLDPTRLRFERVSSRPDGRAQIDPRDQALHRNLADLMETSQVFRQPELTIEAIAKRLSSPTHRVRALINGGLGFRNFPAFVNGFRLAHAKAALADPRRSRETVLSIAFESGFASLQTFNRVFRDAEGVTPTGYRARALAETSQNQKSPRVS